MRVGVSHTILFAVACGALGCTPPEAKFVTSAKTKLLIKEAQKPIEKALMENFGTPHKLVGWELLPVDYGKAESAVAGHEKAGHKPRPAADYTNTGPRVVLHARGGE